MIDLPNKPVKNKLLHAQSRRTLACARIMAKKTIVDPSETVTYIVYTNFARAREAELLIEHFRENAENRMVMWVRSKKKKLYLTFRKNQFFYSKIFFGHVNW